MREDFQCIFCHKSSNQCVIEENGYQGMKCPSCGLIYVSPRPSFEEIQNLYTMDHASISAKSHISEAFIQRVYPRHKLQIVKKYIKNGSLLEIGPGAGYFINEAKKEGFDVYGLELNVIQADFIRNTLGIPCEHSFLDVPFFNGKKFDIIYHCDVISHFYDPIAEFNKISNSLKTNGIVVFETGNLGDVKQKYLKLFPKFQYPDHLFFFSENNLKALLQLTGLELVKIYRYSTLLEMLIIKLLLSKILKKSVDTITQSSAVTDTNIKFSLKRLIKDGYMYFEYLVRYKLGYIMLKKGRPQTVIVVGRKRK